MIKLKSILLEQQSTFKCVEGNCKNGNGQSTDNDGTFVGQFKDGKKFTKTMRLMYGLKFT